MQEDKNVTFSHDKTLANKEANETFTHEKTLANKEANETFTHEKTLANIETSETFTCEKTVDLKKIEQTFSEEKTDVGENNQSVDITETIRANHENDDYEILDEIARGGMGIVFRGKQHSLQREVAIKKMMDNDKNKRNSFVFESLVTAFLDHPNIVPVYELRQSSQQVMLAMKLVGGVPWSSLLHPKTAEDRKLAANYDIQDHINILFSVMNAVDFAHSKKIVHCDLKPSNVMIGTFGEVLVMDWGIAVDIDDDRENSPKAIHRLHIKHPMGTPSYMPIELARGQGRDIGPWTDVYLLGGILYEILTRKVPNSGESILQILAKLTEELQLKFAEDVPTEIQEICVRALQKNKDQRYQEIREFKKDIEDFLKHKASIDISNSAHESLMTSLRKIEELQKNRKKIDGYELIYNDLSSAIANFQQSLKSWAGNTEAIEGEYLARLSYLKYALSNQDIAIAKSQLPALRKFTTAENAIDIHNIERHIQEKDDEKKSIAYIWSRFVYSFSIYGILFCLNFLVELSSYSKNQRLINAFLFVCAITALLSLRFTGKQIFLLVGKLLSFIFMVVASVFLLLSLLGLIVILAERLSPIFFP
ncbi:serine/threonine protein kinase [Candidatus Uabimicrobium amorphum]|uniref:Protein kinase n=1 Tax=Uabimicrobium amorphum TaxID=2596890 RepID=A0A5S9ISC5_UABAM|nr:serine/threonine-protein kinase [Candidatus Uabimicrobium amorphum]BBM86270.1 protein kinase [Candidatus Uabimicrobium amorphum]